MSKRNRLIKVNKYNLQGLIANLFAPGGDIQFGTDGTVDWGASTPSDLFGGVPVNNSTPDLPYDPSANAGPTAPVYTPAHWGNNGFTPAQGVGGNNSSSSQGGQQGGQSKSKANPLDIAHSIGDGLVKLGKSLDKTKSPSEVYANIGGGSHIANTYDAGGWMSAANDTLNSVTEAIGDVRKVKENGQTLQKNIMSNAVTGVNASNNADLLSSFSSLDPMGNVQLKDMWQGWGATATKAVGLGVKGFSSGAKAGGPIAGAVMGAINMGIGFLGGGLQRKAAKKATTIANNTTDAVNSRNLAVLNTKANTLDLSNMRRELYNVAAFGGPLSSIGSAIDYDFANTYLLNLALNALNKQQMANVANPYLPALYADGGGIHIDPSKKGTFTAAASKHGKSVLEFASLVLANKDNYSPAMVKKANFARNASKWHHAFGGDLMTHGATFDDGLTYIGNGNTHELNPYEGVPMGVDQNGTPNLVEEGEVVWDDYVFSNRLKNPKTGKTFAEDAMKGTKESQERPNDPISNTGKETYLSSLRDLQEQVRQEQQQKEALSVLKKYAKGGTLGRILEGEGEQSNYLFDWNSLNSDKFDPSLDIPTPTKVGYTGPYRPLELMGDEDNPNYLDEVVVTPPLKPAISMQITPDFSVLNGPIKTDINLASGVTPTQLAAYPKPLDSTDKGKAKRFKGKANPALLRYAGVADESIQALTDALGITNKFKGIQGRKIRNATRSLRYTEAPAVGTKLAYNPTDEYRMIAPLLALNAAQTAALQNMGNRVGIGNLLLGSAYDLNIALGNALAQLGESNQIKKERITGANNQLDLANAQRADAAAVQNAKQSAIAAEMLMKAAAADDAETSMLSQIKSANRGKLIDSLQGIGREQYILDMINSNPALLYAYLQGGANGNIGYKGNKGACGGYLTIKNKKKRR